MTNPLKQQTLSAIPAEVASAADYERLAADFISDSSYAYISGGCGNEVTLEKNRRDFIECELQQRVLLDIKHGSCETNLLDKTLPHPIILGPVAHQKLAHPKGELLTASGAAAIDTPYIASTLSHFSLEEIANVGNQPKWFQLYFQADNKITLDLVRRAETAGYQALVVTVDVPVNGLRFRSQRAGFTMPVDFIEANLQHYQAPIARQIDPNQSIVFDGLMRDAPTWKEIEWLVSQTTLPVLIKGITHPDDAEIAKSLQVSGIIVSNHGGRSIDGLASALRTIPLVRERVGPDYTLLLDSGIRSGGDIFKAIAAGANAVLIGRLQIYALAVAGALGVAHMLRCLKTELEVTMALSGCATLTDIPPDLINLKT